MYAHTDRQEQMWVSLLSKKDQVMIESRPLATAPASAKAWLWPARQAAR